MSFLMPLVEKGVGKEEIVLPGEGSSHKLVQDVLSQRIVWPPQSSANSLIEAEGLFHPSRWTL